MPRSEASKRQQNEFSKKYSKETGYAAQKKYKEKTKNIMVTLNPETDADILALLDESKPMATQIKSLIREVIASNKNFDIKLE